MLQKFEYGFSVIVLFNFHFPLLVLFIFVLTEKIWHISSNPFFVFKTSARILPFATRK